MHSLRLCRSVQQKGQQKLFKLKNDYIYDLFVKLLFFCRRIFNSLHPAEKCNLYP